jgi:hypothetical protein
MLREEFQMVISKRSKKEKRNKNNIQKKPKGRRPNL